MPGVQHAAYVLVVLRLGTEDGVDLVIKQGWWPLRIGNLAEEVCGRRVDGLNRARNKQRCHFKRPAFPAARLRRQKGHSRSGVPMFNEMRVGDPQGMGRLRLR